jgi:cell division protein FtsB
MELEKALVITVVMVVAIGGWLINNWIRAKYGYAVEDSWGRKVEPAAAAENLRLKAENRELNDKLDAMQDRMIVLEKIVTDRGYSLSAEIEALRDTPAITTERN